MPGARQWNKDRHAIVDVVFALDFTPPPTPRTIRELLALHPKLKDEFPRKQESKGRRIAISSEELETKNFQPEVGDVILAGFTFDSLMEDGAVRRSITLENNGLRVTITDYESWDVTWARARKVFALMLPIIMEHSGVTAFHLHYHDRFIWEGAPNAFSSEQVFRTNSQFLSPHVFQVPELWHSYHGYFEYSNQPQNHQLLNVVEARLINSQSAGRPPEEGPVADIRIIHRAVPGVERSGAKVTPINTFDEVLGGDGDNGALDTYMNNMHDKNKWLLANLINDQLCDMINLDHPE